MDPLGHQFDGGLPACADGMAERCRAQSMQIGRHLTGQQLDEAGAVNADCVAFVAHSLEGLVRPVLHRVAIEVDEGIPLSHYEHIGHVITAAGYGGEIVAAQT